MVKWWNRKNLKTLQLSFNAQGHRPLLGLLPVCEGLHRHIHLVSVFHIYLVDPIGLSVWLLSHNWLQHKLSWKTGSEHRLYLFHVDSKAAVWGGAYEDAGIAATDLRVSPILTVACWILDFAGKLLFLFFPKVPAHPEMPDVVQCLSLSVGEVEGSAPQKFPLFLTQNSSRLFPIPVQFALGQVFRSHNSACTKSWNDFLRTGANATQGQALLSRCT